MYIYMALCEVMSLVLGGGDFCSFIKLHIMIKKDVRQKKLELVMCFHICGYHKDTKDACSGEQLKFNETTY